MITKEQYRAAMYSVSLKNEYKYLCFLCICHDICRDTANPTRWKPRLERKGDCYKIIHRFRLQQFKEIM